MTLVLRDHDVEQRKATLVAKLQALGEVSVSDVPRARRRRLVEVSADAPGADLPRLASFEYREALERAGERWRLIAYAYEFLDRAHRGRRGYHWHDASFHAHCVAPGRFGDQHYRALPMDVFEAHDDFSRIYLSGARINCGDLRPILDWMDSDV